MEKFGTEKHMRVILGRKIRFEKDDCPFCHDIRDHQRVIWQNTNWAILLNKYPYTLDGKHTMLVPIRHITYTHEVTGLEFSNINEAYIFLNGFYAGEEYFSFTRESFANRSVEHLHTHFIAGELKRKALEDMLRAQGRMVNDGE